jgi:hypothetical protein
MAYCQSKDRIAKEFERFVIRRNVLIFVCKGTMDKRAEKKVPVLESVPEFILQFFEIACLQHGPV